MPVSSQDQAEMLSWRVASWPFRCYENFLALHTQQREVREVEVPQKA